MKRTLAILAILTVAATSHAADYLERAVYWCHQNGHTEATLAATEVLNVVTGKGALSYIGYNFDSWKFAGPSKATLDALDGPTVDAWITGYQAGIEADFDAWPDRIKALAKLCRLEINKIRTAHGLTPYSVDDWKAMLQGEL